MNQDSGGIAGETTVSLMLCASPADGHAACSLRRRRQPRLNQPRPYSRRHGAGRNSGVLRDQLLAEIEHLAGELKRKVAGFALFCAVQSIDETSARTNRAAVEWMREALEDIAATALGMEMESREALFRTSQADFLRASEAGKQGLILGTDQDPK